MVRSATPEQAEPGKAVANGAENRVSGRCFASPGEPWGPRYWPHPSRRRLCGPQDEGERPV